MVNFGDAWLLVEVIVGDRSWSMAEGVGMLCR